MEPLKETIQHDAIADDKVISLGMMAGEILIQANAEAYRTEDSLKRIFAVFGYQAEIIAQSTSLIVMITFSDQRRTTLVRRINHHRINLTHIHIVNNISRCLVEDTCTLTEAEEQLQQILKMNQSRQKGMKWFGLMMLGCSFSLVFKGGINEFLASFLIGMIFVLMTAVNELLQLSELMFDMVASLVIAWMVFLISGQFLEAGYTINSSIVLISSIMPMVPGIALTNAFRDLLNGDYVSGSNRLLEALVIAGTIAVGISFGTALGGSESWLLRL